MSSPLRFDGRVVLVTGAGGGKWWITMTVDCPEVSLQGCLIVNKLQGDLCSFLVFLFAFLLKDETAFLNEAEFIILSMPLRSLLLSRSNYRPL